MANIFEPTKKMQREWSEFVASRPANVRAVAEKFFPWKLYLNKPSDHRCTLYSFGEHEDGSVTLTVNITAQFNALMFERQVFGIKPEDLEECELPGEGEPLGALLSSEQVNDNLDALRVMGRPDLWEMDADGKAVRKSNAETASDYQN